MKKKIIITAILVIAVAIGVYYAFFNEEKEVFTLRLDKVSKNDITVQVTCTGTISAVTTVEVGTQVGGIIKNIYADYNSVVKKGQIVARIDSTNLIKTLRDAEINLTKAQVTFDAGERNYNRVKSLYEQKLESQSNYDAALTTYETNRASLLSAKATLENAKVNLDYATIYAPIDGVVISREVNIGQTVSASMSSPTLFNIAYDLSKMQVQATVDEADIGKIDVGQEVAFTVDAYPEDSFKGTIYQIRLSPSVSNNVVNYVVIIDVINDNLKLMPGMTASVKINVASKQNVLRVPNMALRFTPAKVLQDTVKVKEAMGGMRNFGSMMGQNKTAAGGNGQTPPQASAQNNSPQAPAGGQQPPQGFQPGGNGGGQNMTMGEKARQFGNGGFDFKKISAFRDSLSKAKGGNVDREEMMKAIQKRFGMQFGQGMGPGRNNQQAKAPAAKKTVKETFQREIPNIFPQFKKTSYSPADQTSFGRIWVKGANGLLEPIMVRTGITDGRYTEIYSDKLKEGQEIVMGATSNKTVATTTTATNNQQQSSNPFSSSQQRGGGMGGPGPGGPGR